MKFTPYDFNTWERAPLFQHFVKDLRCVMSMTVEMNVTGFLQAIRQRGYKFYPAMLWVVSSAVNSREELRAGYDAQGNVGLWDMVSPYYAHFYPREERFVKLVTEYVPSCAAFCRAFSRDMERYRDLRWFDLQPPPNVFDVSCLPWTHYQSFDMHIFDQGIYLAPVITWGRFAEGADGHITMPLSLNIHHAVADGYHLCRFFADVQAWMEKI